MKATLQTIADLAGVSVTTASNCIAGTGRASRETRERVIAAAQRLGYRSRQRRSREQLATNVAILVSIDTEWASTWRFILPIIQHMERILGRAGYTSVLVPIHSEDDERALVHRILAVTPAAAAPLHCGTGSMFGTLEAEGVPVVILMNSEYQDVFFSVLSDDYHGSFEGTRHLLGLGHRRIAFIGCERPGLRLLRTDRLLGYQKALRLAEIEPDAQLEVTVRLEDSREIAAAVTTFCDLCYPPTAFFCLDDELAMRVVRELRRRGLSVPEDISVVAPGDVLDHDAPTVERPITTMQIDTAQVGTAAGEMVLRRLQRKQDGDPQGPPRVVKINQRLIDRGSCRAV